MHWPPIKKTPDDLPLPPHLLDYHKTCADFSWTAVRRELTGAGGGTGLNMAFEAVDRHANGARANHLALRWLGDDGVSLDFTY